MVQFQWELGYVWASQAGLGVGSCLIPNNGVWGRACGMYCLGMCGIGNIEFLQILRFWVSWVLRVSLWIAWVIYLNTLSKIRLSDSNPQRINTSWFWCDCCGLGSIFVFVGLCGWSESEVVDFMGD